MKKERRVVASLGRLILWAVVVGLAIVPKLQAQSPRALEVLHERLLPLFETAGVVFTDADETTGRLVVGVLDRDVEGLVRSRLPALGVLSQLVDVVETEPIMQVATLNDYNRPVVGGLQIRFSQYLCSLGFNATLNGIAGFVTASHCSTKQGQVDGTKYYQPLNQVPGEFIGTEVADPAYTRSNACPRGRKCRYSDSNFSQFDSSVLTTLGQIAKTTALNSLQISGSYTISGEGQEKLDDIVSKIGRTTGWTQGKLTRTCVDTGVSGSSIVLLCQNFVESNAQIVLGGDSGSPVFSIKSATTVNLLGNLWGGNSSGTRFVYSPIANIKSELGPLVVH